jgi:hypothetical protein
MKNIHLISTDKPSRLHFYDKLFLSTNPQISKDINSIMEGRNIYITSEEEIKEGDYVYTKWLDIVFKVSYFPLSATDSKKIILTTDKELIKDGVQAIDDDFLEWFVKNPSCETVEIDRDEREVGNHLGGVVTEYGDYKIIIPQEQTTEEIPNELEPVLAKISHQNDLGNPNWYEVVYYVDGKWCSYSGSKTFEDGERVVEWVYCNERFKLK